MTLNLPPLPPQTTRFHTHPAPSWGHSRAPTEPGLCGAGTRTHGFPQAGRPPLQTSSSPSQPGKPRRAGRGLGRAAPPPCSRGTHARTRRPSRDPRPFPLSPGSSRPAPAATPSLVYLPVRELLRLLSLRPLHQRGQPRQARLLSGPTFPLPLSATGGAEGQSAKRLLLGPRAPPGDGSRKGLAGVGGTPVSRPQSHLPNVPEIARRLAEAENTGRSAEDAPLTSGVGECEHTVDVGTFWSPFWGFWG